ncbi:PREDICTED: probable purine permease 11 [Nelumbo nucifera]|nr:PREDICTED: probable purine permease 11 [Nelumbo nucifera]
MATLVQTAAFPILLLPVFLFSSSQNPSTTSTNSAQPSIVTVVVVYLFLGILIVGDNMLYSVGLLYLSASTYSLICASQLAFNAVFSFFINSQKFTALIFNSVVLLTLSASLIAFGSDSSEPEGVSKGKYVLGFLCTLGASASYSLILSLMQLSFKKVLKKETFSIVLQMQIFTSLVATFACIVGLFASGEWKGLKEEMDQFGKGKVSYVMTLVWTAVSWQICSVGVVGLIFVVSSLFSNVISTLALPLVPVAAVIVFHDKMDGVKVVAMLLAIWGFASYLYQHYIDDSKLKPKQTNINEITDESMS